LSYTIYLETGCKKRPPRPSIHMSKENHTNKEAEFLKAYEAYNDAIFRYCLFQTSNREKAIDTTQDTFSKTWEYMAEGHTIDNIRAFLYKTAKNLIIDGRRKKKATSLDDLLDDGFDAPFDDRETHMARLDGEKAIALVGELDENYRESLTLRYIEDLTIKEIAETLGESENTISVRIHRGLEKLKRKYNEE
jgi:RNA polymerase sigma factor (sigma-70 family)